MNEAALEQLEESLRGHESLSEVNDFNELTKKYIESGETLKSLRGELEGKVAIPGENASEEVRKAFYQKIGVPDNPEGYGYERPTLPEGMTYDESLEVNMLKQMHAAGVTKSAAKALLNAYNQHRVDEHKRVEAKIKEVEEAELKTLKSVWTGVTFDEKSAKAESMFKTAVSKMKLPEGWKAEDMVKEFEILGFFKNGNAKLKYFMSEMFNLIGEDHFSDGAAGGGSGNPDRKHLEQMYPDMVKK